MRHWLWYKASGEIGGEALVGGGWDLSFDFNNPATLDEGALTTRGNLTIVPDFFQFIVYDCPCDPSVFWCQHSTEQVLDCYVSGGSLVLKPDYDLLLDGMTVTNGSTTDKIPSSTVTLQLSGSVPDGVVVEAINVGLTEVLQTSPTLLTFTSGVTNIVNLTAPAQGTVGRIGLTPQAREKATIKNLRIRGWA